MMTNGIASPISTVTAISTALTVPSTRPANLAAASAPSASRSRSQAGTSAAFNAPSLSSLRTTLTSWKATRKASATAPVPSSAAIIESRANPSSREASVPEETVKKERIIKASITASRVIGRSLSQ